MSTELAESVLRKLLIEWEPGNPYVHIEQPGRVRLFDGWVSLTDEEFAFVQDIIGTQP